MVDEGLRGDVPDLCLPVPVGKFHGYYIELKAKGKKPSAGQLAEINQLRLDGYAADWFDNDSDAWGAIQSYLSGGLEL
jgi:hypothetical protein